MQQKETVSNKRIQDYLPTGWPEIIQAEAKLAGIKRGASIPNIRRVVYHIKVKHKLWRFVWKHVQENKGKEKEVEEILNAA